MTSQDPVVLHKPGASDVLVCYLRACPIFDAPRLWALIQAHPDHRAVLLRAAARQLLAQGAHAPALPIHRALRMRGRPKET